MGDDTEIDPSDPHAEEDAAYMARAEAHRARVRARWLARAGLTPLHGRPGRAATAALRRSLPSFPDAEYLFARVVERLGPRAELDLWAGPNERCLLVRDPEHPEWFLPRRLLYLCREYQPNAPIPMHIELPPQIRRIVDKQRALRKKAAAEAPPAEEEVVALSPHGRPGRLRIEEGPAHFDLTYGEGGRFKECTMTAGDGFTACEPDAPFTLDPFARPPAAPPLSLLLRDEELGDGVTVDELARLVAELRPELADKGRVYSPAPEPGTVTGAWTRALRSLRLAEWEGRVPAEGGWVVIDAWNGTTLAVGPSLESAFAAWKEQVARVQPLPPVERAAPPPPPEQPEEPEAPEGQDAPALAAPEAAPDPEEGTADNVVALPAPAEPAPAEPTVAMGAMSVHFVITPPVRLDWPEPRPENVPAVALPLPALRPVPEALAAAGYTRCLRLFGEHGEVGFTYLREHPDGYTLVGEGAIPAIDLGTLEEELLRIDERSAADWPEGFGRRNPWTDPDYPVRTTQHRVWDDLGREPELRGGQTAWATELPPAVWGPEVHDMVVRARRLRR